MLDLVLFRIVSSHYIFLGRFILQLYREKSEGNFFFLRTGM